MLAAKNYQSCRGVRLPKAKPEVKKRKGRKTRIQRRQEMFLIEAEKLLPTSLFEQVLKHIKGMIEENRDEFKDKFDYFDPDFKYEYWYLNIKDREFIEREQAMVDTVRVKTFDETLPF